MALFREDVFRRNLAYFQILLERGFLDSDEYYHGWKTNADGDTAEEGEGVGTGAREIHYPPRELLDKRHFVRVEDRLSVNLMLASYVFFSDPSFLLSLVPSFPFVPLVPTRSYFVLLFLLPCVLSSFLSAFIGLIPVRF
jgi:hypothetical protein